MNNIDFEHAMAQYKSQHQTVGCIATHMIGIPMIILSLPLVLINFRRALSLFTFGWVLQFIGHYCFEKNQPVLLTKNKRNIWVPIVAVLMVYRYWRAFLTNSYSLQKQNGKIKFFPYQEADLKN